LPDRPRCASTHNLGERGHGLRSEWKRTGESERRVLGRLPQSVSEACLTLGGWWAGWLAGWLLGLHRLDSGEIMCRTQQIADFFFFFFFFPTYIRWSMRPGQTSCSIGIDMSCCVYCVRDWVARHMLCDNVVSVVGRPRVCPFTCGRPRPEPRIQEIIRCRVPLDKSRRAAVVLCPWDGNVGMCGYIP
jgi:hypothetical protein